MTISSILRKSVIAALLSLSSLPAAGQSDTVSVERKIAGLALVWQEANYNFAHFRLRPDLDWDAAFEEAITRVMATESDYAYLRELQRFLALLGEAHTNMEPGPGFRDLHGGHPALELEEIERRPVIVNTANDLAEDIPIGSVILAVDGIPVNEYLAEKVFPYLSASTEHYRWRAAIRGSKWRAVGLLVGDVGTTVALALELPDGGQKDVVVERIEGGAVLDWQVPRRSDAPVLEFRRLDDGIVYFALNTFNEAEVVAEFEKHLDELETARAVILDVRGNGGGNSSHGWHIGKYFSEAPLEPSHWRTRENRGSYKAWGRWSENPATRAYYEMDAWYAPDEFTPIQPPERTFVIPTAILVGPSTYSAAEDFLSFMRAVPHGVFVGQPSAGSTGQPLAFQVPGGGWAGITSKADRMPDGTEFVGVGVQPDIEAQQTIDAYRSGRDPVLEKAVEVLRERTR